VTEPTEVTCPACKGAGCWPSGFDISTNKAGEEEHRATISVCGLCLGEGTMTEMVTASDPLSGRGYRG
jgi:RecJ-like exonuclease